MQVFLIRHPPPRIDPGVCYGRLDVEAIDPAGAAARLRPLLPAGVPVCCSPLRRARILAEALHPAPVIDARLAEIDFGEWEGRRWDDIDRAALTAWADDLLGFVPPGGESVAALQARVLAFAATLATWPADSALALVTHGGVLRALLGHWLRLPVAEWTRLQFAFARVSAVELAGDRAVLRYLNR